MIIHDPKKIATVIVTKMHGDKPPVEHLDEGGRVLGEVAECLKEMWSCLQSEDFEGAAKAFQVAFQELEMAPHEEADHESDEY